MGTLSVADVQFQGKGRAGNSWESPKGCLMFSFILQMSDGRVVPFLQYVVSLAVIEGIESHCTSHGRPSEGNEDSYPSKYEFKEAEYGDRPQKPRPSASCGATEMWSRTRTPQGVVRREEGRGRELLS